MVSSVCQYCFPAFIGVAVAAAMEAAAVGTYVMAQKAGTALPHRPFFIGRNLQGKANGLFHLFFRETAGGICAQGCKSRVFQAGHQLHAMLSPDFHHFPGQFPLVFMAYAPAFRKVPHRFPVEVKETEYAGVGISFQRFRHIGKGADVKGKGIDVGQQDGVIAPADTGGACYVRQGAEGGYCLSHRRDKGFHIPSVGSDGDMPELAEGR